MGDDVLAPGGAYYHVYRLPAQPEARLSAAKSTTLLFLPIWALQRGIIILQAAHWASVLAVLSLLAARLRHRKTRK
ncbi:MAG: hypothetical protein AAFY59_00310 [Pseudomonadota bacterium]